MVKKQYLRRRIDVGFFPPRIEERHESLNQYFTLRTNGYRQLDLPRHSRKTTILTEAGKKIK